ncbi:ralf-like 34 [Euphorbia peplus]|nr:ralf-like 34 [Euphorbia peplus]
MASSHLTFLLFTISLVIPVIHCHVEETGMKIMADALQWPMAMSMYGGDLEDSEIELDGDGSKLDEEDDGIDRRSLFWKRVHYYISYGALSANRIPCPPRSGRSYYTQNCFKSRAPANPYNRGCSRITRCRR